MKPLYFIFFFLSCTANIFGQKKDTIHVHQLDTVTVTEKAPLKSRDVTIGTYVTTISKSTLESHKSRSLSELLSDNSTIYIKSQGQGAMATASFRGTASSHTKVNWNGITLNPSMSSTFDFSQLPVFFTDNVALYYGSGHLKNGTGALGGSINVSNVADWSDETKVKIFAETGSYDTFTEAVSIRSKKEKIILQTRFYYQQSENDYKYLNKVLKLEPFHERRKEADYGQTGVMQEFYYQPDKTSLISSNIWLMYGVRSIPQPIIVNVTTHERNKDHGLNYYLGYEKFKGKHNLSVKGAYLLNIMKYRYSFENDYFEPKNTFNRTQSIQLKADYTYTASDVLYFGISARYSRDIVRTHSKDSTLLQDGVTKVNANWNKARNVYNLQGQVYWKPLRFIALDAHVMGEYNDNDFAPTFSVGASSDIIPNRLNLKASLSYNYRFPSMSDMYWVPGGNPFLKPEKGLSYDATLTYTSKIGSCFYIRSSLSCYRMDITNWIMWLPNNTNYIWTPVNINDVLSQGAEVTLKLDWITDNVKIGLMGNYAYTSSENKNKNFEEDNSQHKQLPYIPLQKANARLSAEWKNFQFAYNVSFTDKRYVTQDESYETPAYTIHNAELSYKCKIRNRYSVTPKITVQNIFDEYYESTQYYPMPLRIVSAGLLFQF